MGILLSLLPYIVFSTLILVSAAIGLHLIFTGRENLLERYESILYSLTQEHPREIREENSAGPIVLYGRLIGAGALLFSLAMCGVAYFYFVGQ